MCVYVCVCVCVCVCVTNQLICSLTCNIRCILMKYTLILTRCIHTEMHTHWVATHWYRWDAYWWGIPWEHGLFSSGKVQAKLDMNCDDVASLQLCSSADRPLWTAGQCPAALKALTGWLSDCYWSKRLLLSSRLRLLRVRLECRTSLPHQTSRTSQLTLFSAPVKYITKQTCASCDQILI